MILKKFIKRFQFEYLLDALKETFARFPLPVICVGASTLLCIIRAHDIKLMPEDSLMRTLLFLLYGLIFFTVARLYTEGTKASRDREVAINSAGGVLLLALVVIPDHITAMHAFIGVALALSMLFAPYIGRRSTEDSVWFYNYINGTALAVSGLSVLVLCIGLCAIVGSMDYLLLNMQLSKKIYGDIWIFGGQFFGSMMFMRQIPRKFDFEKSERELLPGIYFILNYLVVPLILIYVWVLYVYFLKIAVQWELPKGSLAYMVTGFGSVGIAALLMTFPMRNSGTKLLQQFYRYFYYLLIVPIILLAIGLYTRISQYGVTESRYAIGICLAWLFALTVWNIVFKKSAHIKHVPMILAALFLAGSIWPWSAVSISTRSQQARLEVLLLKAGVAHADGTVTKTTQEVPFKLRKDISNILDYMFDGKEKSIKHLVTPFCKEIDKKYKKKKNTCHSVFYKKHDFEPSYRRYYNMPRKVMEAWGMQHVSRWHNENSENSERFNITANDWDYNSLQKVMPYTYMIRLNTHIPTNGTHEQLYRENIQEKLKIKLMLTPGGDIILVLSDGRKATFAISPLANKLFKNKIRKIPKDMLDKMVLRQESNDLRAELRISEIHGRVVHGKFKIYRLTALLLFSP
ncbi:MAG: DUF4153 domain-containing protein [Alphaproteobacteria bacterium]|nr:DUF4153 domain-containing protein [Alphaproteobacteria bacterium]